MVNAESEIGKVWSNLDSPRNPTPWVVFEPKNKSAIEKVIHGTSIEFSDASSPFAIYVGNIMFDENGKLRRHHRIRELARSLNATLVDMHHVYDTMEAGIYAQLELAHLMIKNPGNRIQTQSTHARYGLPHTHLLELTDVKVVPHSDVFVPKKDGVVPLNCLQIPKDTLSLDYQKGIGGTYGRQKWDTENRKPINDLHEGGKFDYLIMRKL